ncbi:MAG: LAGLIDADG family homing endonuclease [Acidobacteriota bacterium]
MKNRAIYNKDSSYFKLPNPENSYWAGFIAADGCLYAKKNQLLLYTAQKHRDHLRRFASAVQYDGPIVEMKKNKSAFQSYSSLAGLQICGVSEWLRDLELNFNVTPKKSHTLQPPTLADNDCILAFVVGYLDGDGCINLFDKDRKQPYVSITFTSGSEDILAWIRDFFDENYPTARTDKAGIYRLRSHNPLYPNTYTFRYRVNGVRAKLFLNQCIDADIMRLKSKWEKYELWRAQQDWPS